MSSDLWYGALLSIPIGIGTALATPWLQRQLDKYSKSRALTRTKKAQEDFSRVKFFVDNPHLFTQYLVYTAVRVLFITAVVAAFSAAPSLIAQFSEPLHVLIYPLQSILYGISQFISLIGSIMIVNICRPALLYWQRTKNFEEYSRAING